MSHPESAISIERRRTTSLLLLGCTLAGLALAVSACGADDATSGAPCEVDEDCDKGERCNLAVEDGHCAAIRTVESGEACSTSELCADGGCVEDECVGVGSRGKGESCGGEDLYEPFKAACKDGLTCVYESAEETSTDGDGSGRYVCRKLADELEPCESSRDCLEELSCDDDKHICILRCSYDDDACPDGYACAHEAGHSVCHELCEDDADCPEGAECYPVADQPYCGPKF